MNIQTCAEGKHQSLRSEQIKTIIKTKESFRKVYLSENVKIKRCLILRAFGSLEEGLIN